MTEFMVPYRIIDTHFGAQCEYLKEKPRDKRSNNHSKPSVTCVTLWKPTVLSERLRKTGEVIALNAACFGHFAAHRGVPSSQPSVAVRNKHLQRQLKTNKLPLTAGGAGACVSGALRASRSNIAQDPPRLGIALRTAPRG